jgi:S-DNA-T family DNA segregation ATPase FtsK/SpoIIIE
MIQSYLSDSLFMEIKKITSNAFTFVIKRFIELFGFFITIMSILLFASLITYSPEDPNFIFPENTEIKNVLGFRGSFTADIFFQSIGLISILVSTTIFFTGINLIRSKKFIIIIENLFHLVLYTIFGCLFYSTFHHDSFWLLINGNGGFIGKFLKDSFLFSLIDLNQNISYFVILILTLIIFLFSINFRIKFILNLFKKIFLNLKFFFKRNIFKKYFA